MPDKLFDLITFLITFWFLLLVLSDQGYVFSSVSFVRSIKLHYFHLVELSPWPIATSLGCLSLTVGIVMFVSCEQYGLLLLVIGLFLVVSVLLIWWRDVLRESSFQGHHTLIVQAMLKYGFGLFILSELMFFVSWFWAFYNSFLSAPIQLGSQWPSNCVDLIEAWGGAMI